MFITIEGIDGTGKSTQAKLLADYINKKTGKETVLTREPGGWDGGADLRKMVIEGRLTHKWSEAFLFMLDRTEHVERVIKPALNDGKIVISERYHDSTIAYQVWGRGLPLEIFDELFTLSELPKPDVKILLDLPVDIAFARVTGRGCPDAFESAGHDFMNRIRNGYIELAKHDPERWIIVDVNKTPDEIFKELTQRLSERGIV